MGIHKLYIGVSSGGDFHYASPQSIRIHAMGYNASFLCGKNIHAYGKQANSKLCKLCASLVSESKKFRYVENYKVNRDYSLNDCNITR